MTRLLLLASLVLLATPFAFAQPNPVTNGGFETLGPNGFPADWSILGDVSVSNDAHSGKNAVLIKRDKIELEAGLNRDWKPDSGEQGTMLSELKGGIRFWYKVLSASDDAALHFFVIPMSKRPMEDTGDPRADFLIPRSQTGDGKWHMGLVAYDFTQNPDVKWVHLSPRIMGSEAKLLLDDVEWLEKAGPVLSITGLRWEEDQRKPGERATLAVRVRNIGDVATHAAMVRVTCPDYLHVAGAAEADVPTLPPDELTELRFAIDGRRDRADAIAISASEPAATAPAADAEFRLEPKAETIQLRADRFILARGEATTLRAIVRGTGTAIATDISGKLDLSDAALDLVEAPTGPVEAAPGREVALTWKVRAQQETASTMAIARLLAGRVPLQDGVSELVVGPKAGPAPERAGAHVERDTAWLQGEGIRLVVHQTALGFGIGDLQVKRTAWETVGRVPSMGRIVLRAGDVGRDLVPLYGAARAEDDALVVDCAHTDAAGAEWTATITFALRDDGRNIGVTSSLRCNRTAKLLAFDAPMLYVGEGSFGSAKDEALFPGLDWLDKDDVSSEYEGKLIAKGHPHQVRYVPHPQMITIPLMSVYHDGTTVGLLWDCRRKWDDSHDRPAACFGSPDRFEGRNAHLMGLFVPSVAEEGKPWVRMNEREAWTPYELPANREISVESVIYARTGTHDALAAMDEWFRIYGPPKPLSYPQGTVPAEVVFNMRAYLESLWVPKEQEWWTSRGAGKLLSPKGRPMSFVHELLKGALIVDDPLVKQRCRARAEEVLGLANGDRPMWMDAGFDYGRADDHLVNLGAQAMAVMAGQGKDGAWRFDADRMDPGIFKGMDYHRLGPDNAAELGTCAQSAYTLLRFARMSGESRAYEAGVKALKFMEQYRVPRAAQVWEVMVHAPDILAAADAVDAYLEGYQYDGNREWLDEAVRWGRGGLPFVYLWDDPEKPFILGASIPVFGASWESGSWFGRPVQWNGLRHARALLKLARYDDSLPWRQLAQTIVVSAMYQQSTDPDDVALWPDSISAIDGSKAGWIFAPVQISEPFYTLIGRQEEPDTVMLGKLPQRLYLNSGADIKSAAWEGDKVTATLSYPSGEFGYTVLVGVARPEEVLLDGAPLTQDPRLDDGDAAGWRYNGGAAMCVVRITADGEHQLEIRGVHYQNPGLMPETANRIAFDFDKGLEGWMAAHDIGTLSVKDGVLQVPVTGGDPYMVRNFLSVSGESIKEVVVRMKASESQGAQFYWGTAAAPGFAEARVFNFPIIPDGEWHDYRIPVGTHAAWKGQTITGIRLDPLQPGVAATVEIDSIRGE
jgi:hypothetical protein